MTPTLTYEEKGHRYYVDGKPVPGLTHVLSDMGYNGSGAAFFTENSRHRGTGVHLVCASVDRYAPDAKTMDEALSIFGSPLDPVLLPYLAGWLLFRKEHGWRATEWEVRSYSERLRIAGSIDAVGLADNDAITILDVKTWKPSPKKAKRSADLQTAGYAMMYAGLAGRLIQRWIVDLPGDGRYRLFRCEDARDFDVVQSLSAVWWDQYNAGLRKMAGDPEEMEDGE